MSSQDADPDSLLNHYRALIHLRNAHSALRTGGMTVLDPGDRALYGFTRSDETETLLVVLDFGTEPVMNYDLPGMTSAEVLFGGGWEPGSPIPPLSGHVVQLDG